MKRIYDKDFKYTPSFETNVKQTFARIRRQLEARIDVPCKDAVLKNSDNVVKLGSKHGKPQSSN